MDLSLLRTFLAVHRAGSFTAAAARLRLSQPTVTAQIRALENHLGQQLFQRRPRGVVPTSVAEELAGQVAPHVDALAAVAERALFERGPFTTPLHLAGPAELICARVLPGVTALVERGLILRVSLGLASDLLEGLHAGRHDMVISTIRPRGKTVTSTPLTDEEFVLVASPQWADRIDREWLRHEGAVALREVPLVAYADDLPIIRRYWTTVFGSRPTARPVVVVPDIRGVLAATVAGAGITVLPSYLCGSELASGALIVLTSPEESPINTLFVAVRTGTETLPHIAAVRTHLLAQARQW